MTREEDMVYERIQYLRDQTDFISTVFDTLVGYGIIAADFDGNIIAYNEGAHQIFGYTPMEMIGKEKIERIFSDEFIKRGMMQKIVNHVIGLGRYSFETDLVRMNREPFPAHVTVTLTKNRDDRAIGIVIIADDLTERKRMEAAATEARETTQRNTQLERELRMFREVSLSFEEITRSAGEAISEGAGGTPLRESSPELFADCSMQYAKILDKALEQLTHKTDFTVSDELRTLAGQLGVLRATPRDIVELHDKVIKSRKNGVHPKKYRAYIEEGRYRVLELMGYLASFYRMHAKIPLDRNYRKQDLKPGDR
jgi:PAS domain S-box-containing protein